MIRFIDMRGQGTGYRFAFFNTVTSNFRTCGGEQGWTNWEDFEGGYTQDPKELPRYKSLCPEWVFDDVEDDLDKFYGG